MAATPTAKFVEWLDLASSILAEPVQPLNGQVTARGPGLGIDWDEKAIQRYTA
jgi:mandelate racemase